MSWHYENATKLLSSIYYAAPYFIHLCRLANLSQGMLTEAIVQCHSIAFTVLGSLSLLFNTVTIIVICYESPASMQGYKYCLLNLTVTE